MYVFVLCCVCVNMCYRLVYVVHVCAVCFVYVVSDVWCDVCFVLCCVCV